MKMGRFERLLYLLGAAVGNILTLPSPTVVYRTELWRSGIPPLHLYPIGAPLDDALTTSAIQPRSPDTMATL